MDGIVTAPTPDELRRAQSEVLRTFYHQKQDLGAYLDVARALFTLAGLLAERDEANAEAYRLVAVAISYNIATCCWPGWDEPEIEIDAEALDLGLQAALVNVALAAEIGLPPERRKNGQWVLGAQHFAAGDYPLADMAFREAAQLCAGAGLAVDAAAMRAWVHAARLRAGDHGSRDALGPALAELRALGEDGEFYAEQVETALRVIRPEDRGTS